MGKDISVGQNGTVISLGVLQKLIAFMLAMLTAPIASFYAVRHLFLQEGSPSGEATTAGAFGATFTVVLIMAAYVVVAFMEEDDEPPKKDGTKEDDSAEDLKKDK
eukprot:m.37479 g.37479  ORF g.37479 m.37479 type:complete len:105 (-) comp7703_c0_seq1:245-559(-)